MSTTHIRRPKEPKTLLGKKEVKQCLEWNIGSDTISKFEDDFEGVWDLIVQDDGVPSSFVREFEGDVVVSPSVSLMSSSQHEFTS